jgi:hypothetical protein
MPTHTLVWSISIYFHFQLLNPEILVVQNLESNVKVQSKSRNTACKLAPTLGRLKYIEHHTHASSNFVMSPSFALFIQYFDEEQLLDIT